MQSQYQNLEIFRLPDDFRGRPGWYVQLWWIVEALLFRPSPQFLYGWRRWLLRQFGASVGRGAIIRPTVRTQFPWKVSIGDHAWIGDDVVLYSLGPIEIGNDVVVSQKTYLCTGSHDPKAIDFTIFSKPIIIEPECWIATDVYVAPGVRIGRGTLVGARSSVFKDLPAGKICMGSPARVIKDRKAGASPVAY
ncbi:putative colanic acid biosynthesis acetyltransferase WcaF [Neolewinella xylanilytica]|uniref:Putative colanic acid biosynthesis acetyltransferase WcaF n=1 Tax=Neolewinella xylanilytica TaxID=1514080 RepID=A0A2S6I7P2_9BACT|nr:putative colanic acid biosynthesis acetyltransferase [Neolewinella xylanilytica]PPK87524.1 putative colanic acid biosynthesis acetyltransferase WcaF [Neolewinella xylanilytica]